MDGAVAEAGRMTIDRALAADLTIVKELRDPSHTRHQHARAALRGLEVRVGRGAYAPKAEWERLDDSDRHRVRMTAFARTRAVQPVFSHWSAAVWHGLPVVGGVPDLLHITVGRSGGGRSGHGVRAHSTAVDAEDVVRFDGLLMTSVARTVVDIAATAPTPAAVSMADHVLRAGVPRRGTSGSEPDRADLLSAWERALPLRGHRRALDVIEFADGRADSPLESVSRANMRAAGITRPVLQTQYSDRAGLIGYVDFSWPERATVGEADGDAKYLDSDLRGGRSADRVVLDEKIREDRLRALGLRVVRWRWETAQDPRALAALLCSG